MWSTAKVIGTGPGEVGYTRGLSSWKKEKRKKQRGDEMLWKLWQSYRGFPLPPAFTGVTLPLAALPEHIEVAHHMEKPGFIYRAWGRPSRRSQQSSVIPIIKAKEKPSSLALLSQLSCEFLRQKPTKIKTISLSLEVFMLLSGHTSSWLAVEQTHCFQKNFWQFSPLLNIRQLLYAVLSSIHNCLNSYKNSQIILISHKQLGEVFNSVCFESANRSSTQLRRESEGQAPISQQSEHSTTPLCYLFIHKAIFRNQIKHSQENRTSTEARGHPTASLPKQNLASELCWGYHLGSPYTHLQCDFGIHNFYLHGDHLGDYFILKKRAKVGEEGHEELCSVAVDQHM